MCRCCNPRHVISLAVFVKSTWPPLQCPTAAVTALNAKPESDATLTQTEFHPVTVQTGTRPGGYWIAASVNGGCVQHVRSKRCRIHQSIGLLHSAWNSLPCRCFALTSNLATPSQVEWKDNHYRKPCCAWYRTPVARCGSLMWTEAFTWSSSTALNFCVGSHRSYRNSGSFTTHICVTIRVTEAAMSTAVQHWLQSLQKFDLIWRSLQ